MENISFVTRQHLTENQFVTEHSHRCWELVFYHTCSGISKIGDTQFLFGKNTFAIIPPNCPHNELHYKTGSLIFIGFLSSHLQVDPGVYSDTENQMMNQIITLILSEFQNRFSDSEKILEYLLQAMIILLNRICNKSNTQQSDLFHAKRFIDENLNWKINFHDLAKSNGLAYDVFRRNFKKEFGISPKNYLINLRLKKAKKLLENSDHNCTQIAIECGFSDSAQFSTMFHKKYGVSPKKYAAERKPINDRESDKAKMGLEGYAE